MRSLFYAASLLAVMALAVWAYNENHKTQQSQARVAELRREIVSLREAIGVQRAEWAYLNRPDRLRDLVDMNFSRLALLPMTGAQFGRIDEIAYPPRAATPADGPALSGVIEVLGDARHAIGPSAATSGGQP
ncbi:MAG: Shugoshin N-terminal coiled-coil region [Rhodobacteraceae bacterium HLUCCA12]|nr:MAG: Shugoshin N-terminal coiled-coil region [Rhodobacteraceae bacterium HLUCCA12]